MIVECKNGMSGLPGAVINYLAKRGIESFQEKSHTYKHGKVHGGESKRTRQERWKRTHDEALEEELARHGYKRGRYDTPVRVGPRMAYRGRRRFSRRRRPVSYRRRKFTRKVPRPLVPYGFRQSETVKIKNVLRVQLTCTAGAIGTKVYKLNSLNDPWGADAQLLPLGLDQWAGFYTKYKIYGARVHVKMHAVAATGAIIVGLHQSNDSTALSTADQYILQKNSTYKMFSSDLDLAELNWVYKPKKAWSLRNMRDADDQEGEFSTTPGDPTDLSYLHFFIVDAIGTDTATAEMLIEITSLVHLYDPVSLATSTL